MKMTNFFQYREWMDRRLDSERNCVSDEFIDGIIEFIEFACNQTSYQEQRTLLCPCARCRNVKTRGSRTVQKHLFLYGFKGNYYVWTSHGENCFDVGEASGVNHLAVEDEAWDDHSTNIQVPVDTYEYVQDGDVHMAQGDAVNIHDVTPNFFFY